MRNFLRAGANLMAENMPSIVFLAMLRLGADMANSAWCATILAWAVLFWLWRSARQSDTILLGVNIHFALAAPVIHGVYALGYATVAGHMLDFSGVAVIGAVFVTGLVLNRVSESGFIGQGYRDASGKRSGVLLLVAGLALLWSLAFMGHQLVSVGLPLLVLFATRRVLMARAARNGNTLVSGFLALGQFAKPPSLPQFLLG